MSKMMKKFYSISSFVYYFSFLPYIKLKLPEIANKFQEREFDYGIIATDFRSIKKNINNTINKLDLNNKTLILIGHFSKNFKRKGITYLDFQEINKL